jgi:hypothetical protein
VRRVSGRISDGGAIEIDIFTNHRTHKRPVPAFQCGKNASFSRQ